MTLSRIHGDDSLPSNIDELLALAIDAEEKYLTTLREEGKNAIKQYCSFNLH